MDEEVHITFPVYGVKVCLAYLRSKRSVFILYYCHLHDDFWKWEIYYILITFILVSFRIIFDYVMTVFRIITYGVLAVIDVIRTFFSEKYNVTVHIGGIACRCESL